MKRLLPDIYLLSLLIVTFSCTDKDIIDGGDDSPTNKKINEWIYKTMFDNYLWYDEMPDETKVKNYYNYDPDLFFRELLSSNDGKTYVSDNENVHYYYSYIQQKTGTKSYQGDEPGFGFEYQAWNISNIKRIGLQVLYVLPGSPAEDHLKRGDWIFQINGSNVGNNYYDLIANSTTSSFGVAENWSSYSNLRQTGQLTKIMVEDNPVLVDKLFTFGSTKVGYMVYNHFTTGPDGISDTSFDKTMLETIQNLANQGANEFILDLRYNGGGYVESARKMASALVPSEVGNTFCKMTYNNKNTNKNSAPKFISTGYSGLNINRLFVITSSRTASASELVIAGLQPYMEIIIVGETTEGKNVGSVEYEKDDYDWVLHPIVCTVTNSKDLEYSDGFDPTTNFHYYYSVEANLTSLSDLGDENEEILKGVLNFINTGRTPSGNLWIDPSKVKSASIDITPLNSSLDRKATNGVILNLE